MKITKLLSLDSHPAPALLARATKIELTLLERITPPAVLTAGGVGYENALGEVRPLEVGDILVDERGQMHVVEAAVEKVLKVTGDEMIMQEAVYAFTARGLRVGIEEDGSGFSVPYTDGFQQMFEHAGLKCTVVDEPFLPIIIPQHHGGGCCCGGHEPV
ncbi:MAG: hypothetical protein HUK26_06860, partial [Duodenibacillus sp.]|nr:hypothetical protein [Duodenibacillus sp.]